MRRGATVRNTLWVVLPLALAGLRRAVEAGPFVTSPLLTGSSDADVEGRGLERPTAPSPLMPGSPVSVEPRPDALRLPSLNELGYPAGLPSAASGGGVSEQVVQALPAGRVASPDLARIVPSGVRPLPPASGLTGNPKRLIPEPASALLFVTGLVGLWARRRLLRDRNRPTTSG